MTGGKGGWHFGVYLEQVLCQHELGQVLTLADGFRQVGQPVLVHFKDGQLLQGA